MNDVSAARVSGADAYAPPPGALAERPTWTPGPAGPPPLYWRLLRLRHVRPNGWQRALLVEGIVAVAVTLVLADVASAWTLVVLPVASAIIVKAHDVLTGLLPRSQQPLALPPPSLSDYAPFAVATGFLLFLRLALHGGGQRTFAAVVYALNGLLCFAIYRYLVRRNTTRELAVLIALTGFFLSVLAAALGAALEVRRHRSEP